ncbi:MAG: response regulator transcription factor [Elusimicrobia bacterium]|nr:response regulator transcription factor [Elusimicrobiota bacterium]
MDALKAVFLTRDASMAGSCSSAFREASVDLYCVADGRAFKDVLREEFDALMIDAEAINAFSEFKNIEDVVVWFRSRHPDRILIVISGSTTSSAVVAGLINLGANDVAEKPPKFRVMAQQIKSLAKFIRHKSKKSAGKISLKGGAISIDAGARKCFISVDAQNHSKLKEVKLTKNEFKIISILVSRRGRLATYDDFKEKIWPDKLSSKEIKHGLLQHIADLRKKIGPHGQRIESVWGEGYRIRDE